jgi:hypothetical protein
VVQVSDLVDCTAFYCAVELSSEIAEFRVHFRGVENV